MLVEDQPPIQCGTGRTAEVANQLPTSVTDPLRSQQCGTFSLTGPTAIASKWDSE